MKFYTKVFNSMLGKYISTVFLSLMVIVGCDNQQNDSAPNAPDNLQYSVVSSSQINLTWNDNSDNEYGFEIEQSQDCVNYIMIDNVPENTTTYDVMELSEEEEYCFRVLAYNDYGSSEYSNIIVSVTGSILDSNYSGTLYLRFSNTFPEFDESTQVAVEIDKYGGVTFETGTLSYEGEDDNGQSKLKRSGTLTLAPYGNVFHANGGIIIEVDENTSFNERFQQWVWDKSTLTWIPVMDENFSGTWNGGLGFDLDEAVISGSTVGVTNAQGSVIWTLVLTPTLVD
jgi:hypothetical protein